MGLLSCGGNTYITWSQIGQNIMEGKPAMLSYNLWAMCYQLGVKNVCVFFYYWIFSKIVFSIFQDYVSGQTCPFPPVKYQVAARFPWDGANIHMTTHNPTRPMDWNFCWWFFSFIFITNSMSHSCVWLYCQGVGDCLYLYLWLYHPAMAAACIQCIIALVVCLCSYIRQVANIGSDLFECVQHQIFYLTNASESIPFVNSALAP